MIALPAYKKLLGEEAQNLTDKEIEQIRDVQYQFAELAFYMWAKQKKLNDKL